MCDWVIQAGELLRPITASMRLELLTGDYIQADKAPLMVQVPGLGRNYRAHLWQYSRPRGSLVFDFQMGRGREGPRNHLTGRNLPAPYLSANNRSSGTKPQPPRFIITSRSNRSNRAVKVTILPSCF
jgi:Transposase IS66 family